MMKKYILALLVIGGCSAAQIAPSNIQLCEQTVRDYAVFRDDSSTADAYANLFTDDGEFHLAGNVTKGHGELISRHQASNNALQWRHNMTDIRIEESNGQILGTTRFHIFAGPRTEGPTSPNREILGDYMDAFVIVNGLCKIKTRKVKVIFDKKS